jgi:glycosyltransferase involved in cell wall biosynthesis
VHDNATEANILAESRERVLDGRPDRSRVSVIVATRNRAGYLRHQLRYLTETFRDELVSDTADIWVFDDASSDETARVCAEFADRIHYRSATTSVGAIEARRRLMAEADGDYLVHLDDDSSLLDADALVGLRRFFAVHPRCGAIAANIATRKMPAGLVPTGQGPLLVGTFTGCGCVLRTEALRISGYYPKFLQGIQAEEQALSLRLLEDGYDVFLVPWIRVVHAEDPVQRPILHRRAAQLANEVGIVIAGYPWYLVLPGLAYKVLSYVRYNLRQGTLRPVARDAFSMIGPAAARALADRRPVRLQTLIRFRRRLRALHRLAQSRRPGASSTPWPELETVFPRLPAGRD